MKNKLDIYKIARIVIPSTVAMILFFAILKFACNIQPNFLEKNSAAVVISFLFLGAIVTWENTKILRGKS